MRWYSIQSYICLYYDSSSISLPRDLGNMPVSPSTSSRYLFLGITKDIIFFPDVSPLNTIHFYIFLQAAFPLLRSPKDVVFVLNVLFIYIHFQLITYTINSQFNPFSCFPCCLVLLVIKILFLNPEFYSTSFFFLFTPH